MYSMDLYLANKDRYRKYYSVIFRGCFKAVRSSESKMLTLFDFTKTESVNNWIEVSDTVRRGGSSKAVLSLQKTQLFQNAIFFTVLNPLQPQHAGFAGVKTVVDLNLTDYKNITIRCKSQGQNEHYKIVLNHKGHGTDTITYEQFFQVPLSNVEFDDYDLSFADFKAYFRGQEVKDAEPLDLARITSFGIQIFAGVYTDIKQSGVSALSIEKIHAT
ncbi:uncharacterized protein LOC116337776 isoform X2 [Contarinia nasturtii]|uniref:uncharacterized protein LOC116337776 isoform X2 n=1 Tax=Contarinia nasturtii TaxID=265458 RepID=UPI0012D3F6C6|nr:uncharacterized protein LOC116337776 isoform X2 [Contarinia nasturtii]